MNINPYTVRAPATGPIEIVRNGNVVKVFNDIRKADGYARGLWDAELRIIKALRDVKSPADAPNEDAPRYWAAADYIKSGDWL